MDNVSYDTLPETEPTIKRFRRGDVREDGKIFWGYYKIREYWVLPERFARLNENVRKSRERQVYTPEACARMRETSSAWSKRNRARINEKRSTPEALARRKDKWRSTSTEKRAQIKDKWRARSAAQRAYANRRHQEWKKYRRNTDPVFAMSERVRSRINGALKKLGESKSRPSLDMVGCSWLELKGHLENQFLLGMMWDNRERWEVDHIVPLALAKTEQDVIDLNHYTNLRPLWKADNLLKSDSLPPRELVPEHLLRFIDPSS